MNSLNYWNKSTTVSRETFDEVLVPTFAPSTFIPVRGSGLDLLDQNGKQYLDLMGGIAVSALGHAPAELVEVLVEQGKKLWHVSNYFTNEPVLKLGKALIDATFANSAFLCNLCAEANEVVFNSVLRWAYDHYGS